MKKLIATTLLCTAAGLAAFGQGTVNFANAGVGLNSPVYLNDGVTKAGAGYTAALLAGPSATSLAQIATAAVGAVQAGYFLGGTQVIPTVAGGATADILIEIYQTTSGSFASAKAANVANTWAWSGGGTPFTVTLGNPGTTPPGTPATLSGLGPMTLNTTVPEPSTFALVGLGAAAMLIFRRRK